MRLFTGRLKNDYRLAYSPDARLLLLVSPGGHDAAAEGVAPSAVDSLLAAESVDELDAAIAELWDSHPSPLEQCTYASLQELASVLARQAGRAVLRVSAHEAPLPIIAYALDPNLTEVLCERDAECGGDHYWIWVSVGDEDFVFHFDWERGVAVPPTPLQTVYG